MPETTKRANNTVIIEGYLKENGLQVLTTRSGKEAIAGTITIALDEREEYRVRLFAQVSWNNGSANPNFERFEALLPANTTSIATILKANPNAPFDGAIKAATKVWVRASFEVYDRKDKNGIIHSNVVLQGQSAGLKTSSPDNPFVPSAKFDIDGYVEAKKDEVVNNEPTGRKIVSLLLPDYWGDTVYPIDFVCETPSAVNSLDYYEVGSSGRFVGKLKNFSRARVIKGEVVTFLDGTVEDSSRTVYDFVNEREIERMTAPYEPEMAKYISPEDVKRMKATREAALEELEVAAPKTETRAVEQSQFKGFEI